MTLTNEEFTRRFAQHILPHRFVRIRHYGMLSNAVKLLALPMIREQLQPGMIMPGQGDDKITTALPPTSRCPCCKKGIMQVVMDFDHRGPPVDLIRLLLRQETPAT